MYKKIKVRKNTNSDEKEEWESSHSSKSWKWKISYYKKYWEAFREKVSWNGHTENQAPKKAKKHSSPQSWYKQDWRRNHFNQIKHGISPNMGLIFH